MTAAASPEGVRSERPDVALDGPIEPWNERHDGRLEIRHLGESGDEVRKRRLHASGDGGVEGIRAHEEYAHRGRIVRWRRTHRIRLRPSRRREELALSGRPPANPSRRPPKSASLY